jgi:hypothetical protein
LCFISFEREREFGTIVRLQVCKTGLVNIPGLGIHYSKPITAEHCEHNTSFYRLKRPIKTVILDNIYKTCLSRESWSCQWAPRVIKCKDGNHVGREFWLFCINPAEKEKLNYFWLVSQRAHTKFFCYIYEDCYHKKINNNTCWQKE